MSKLREKALVIIFQHFFLSSTWGFLALDIPDLLLNFKIKKLWLIPCRLFQNVLGIKIYHNAYFKFSMYLVLRIKSLQATYLINLTPILFANRFLQKSPAPFLKKTLGKKAC